VLSDFLIFGELSGLKLGVDQLTVNAYFETAAIGRDEDELLEP